LSMNVIVLEPGTTHTVPGMDENIGHSHDDIDEVYVVVSGEVTVKIDDDELTLGPLDAVRIAPAAKRATRNTSDTEVTIVMFSQKMHDPRAQSHFHDGFWPAR
jgi:mannose-6-phosphate isomerase-like protein (cupin superfamily)